ncbi:MAG: PSD1 and planctomycete cytochrome C domain-containing protein [Planctomycetota bacterium]
MRIRLVAFVRRLGRIRRPTLGIGCLTAWIASAMLAGQDLPAGGFEAKADPGVFARDVEPVLRRCTECHGSQRQRRGLRVDSRAALLRGGRSGAAVVPGDPDASLLVQRVSGIGKRMPPTGSSLTEQEIAALRTWIAGGAPMPAASEAADDARPWAWRPVAAAEPPASGHPIDAFVDAALQREGLSRTAPAARGKLLRRASLDLTGLPPTPAEIDAFAADTAPDAFERAVDRLLASPHFGEHWAQMWLDLARYADTKGYEKDARRSIWRYRDWVIDAFNADMPFDRFTIAQLAGDLLADPSLDDLVATAFHRNTMTNDEGGTDDEEFRVAAVVDRVNTTMATWMGTTIGCCQCHDHKYDRLSQREYYQLLAYFDNTADDDHESDRPTIEAPTSEQRDAHAVRRQVQAELRELLRTWGPERERACARWVQRSRTALAAHAAARVTMSPWWQSGPYRGRDFEDASTRAFLPESDPARARWSSAAYRDGEVHTFTPGDNVARYLMRTVRTVQATPATLVLGCDDAMKVWLDGELVAEFATRAAAARDQRRVVVQLPAGESRLVLKVVNGGGPSGFAFEVRALPLAGEAIELLAAGWASADSAGRDRLRQLYRDHGDELEPLRQALASVERDLAAMPVPTVPVLRELPPDRARVTRVHRRGSFLDQGEVVARDVPAALHPWPSGAPRNRLGLAQWIVSADNPLTARVLVNRLWERLFGRGLVETSDDFGVQGDPPSHPELLDWLAADLMAHGWSVKHTLATIVTSATYRQGPDVAEALRLRDPDNRLLARGPRGRLSAEAIRDQALAVAGLLSAETHGPSVMPPQPDGVWSIIYSNDRWQTAVGPDRYRRGLYTFWRRTSPYPSMLTFDAPSREFCVVHRVSTNTPLQALVTLNDPVFTEAATALAERMEREGGDDPSARLSWGFLACTGRRPAPDELERLLRLYRDACAADDAEATARRMQIVANVLLNLDETLTKG